jgi:3-methyladenine DNA glycosylase/8-oxoguanine DNA glycosylase
MNLTLPARPPFSFSAVVRSHGWAQLEPFSWDNEAQTLGYILGLKSGKIIAISIREGAEGIVLKVRPPLKVSEQKEVKEKVNWMFGLEQDFTPFYALASQEAGLAHVENQAMGRVLRSATLFEDCLKTMLTTNTTWGGTIRMVEALVNLFGEAVDGKLETGLGRAFPTPERLATTDETTLRQQAKLGYRAPYVLELAQRVARGDLNLEDFKTSTLPTVELRKLILEIKGIGSYAAANLLMILGRYDYLPVDSWALNQVSNEWFDSQPIQPTDVEKAFERWGEWRGLVYWFWNWQHQ